jgi:endo-1,4-beta-mannosidase
MRKVWILTITCLLAFGIACCSLEAKSPAMRWSEGKANEWYAGQKWPVGFNYVTSTAINEIEMWQNESFDPKTIDREMGLAQGLGFNTVRIFLDDIVWEADPKGFKKNIDTFLGICDRHGLKVIATFFTNGGKYDSPKMGKQPEAIQGVHNSQWIQSPGAASVNDSTTWPRLERYIKDILGSFKKDKRILYWCLYNEPENFKQGAQSLPLLRAVFRWAREVNPTQPLSSPIWICPGMHSTKTNFPIVSFLGENCDIMTFHCYYGPEEMETFISYMKQFNRPMVCQEYMGRPRSTFQEIMPILKREGVGAISWGLVNGKCNFNLQWSSKAGDPEPEIWFHDIFRQDGTPYSEEEVEFIKAMTIDNNKISSK